MADDALTRDGNTVEGHDEQPEVYAIRKEPGGWHLTPKDPGTACQGTSDAARPDQARRRLLAGLGIAATAASSQACGLTDRLLGHAPTPTPEAPTATHSPASPMATVTPTPTRTPRPTATPYTWASEAEATCQGLVAHTGSLVSMDVAAEPSLIATAAVGDRLKVWSLPSGGLVASFDYTTPFALVNGDLLLASTAAHEVLRVPLVAGSAADALATMGGSPIVLSVSRDGTLVAVGDDQGLVTVWSLDSGEQRAALEGHDDIVMALAISPDGRLLASGTVGGGLKLWSLGEGSLVADLTGPEGYVRGLAFTADSRLLAAAGGDGSVHLWSAQGVASGTIEPDSGAVSSLAISPDGALLVCSSEDAITTWSLPAGSPVARLECDGACGGAMAMSSDGQWLAVGDDAGVLRVCSLRDLTVIARGPAHASRITTLAFSARGSLIVTGAEDGTVKLWSSPSATFSGCLADATAIGPDIQLSTYSSQSGTIISTYTLPCGSTIPEGAVCVCNCVAGSTPGIDGLSSCACDAYAAPCSCDSYSSSSHYWYPN